jgi:hypothetical protein
MPPARLSHGDSDASSSADVSMTDAPGIVARHNVYNGDYTTRVRLCHYPFEQASGVEDKHAGHARACVFRLKSNSSV